MADVSLSARVAAILGSLQSLTRMAPGMPVRAEDWNTVVGAIVDVARLMTTETFSAPPHTHIGLVSRDWLDPSLADFVDTTRERQQSQADELEALKQRMDRVERRLSAFDQTLGTLQSQADREADARLDRDILTKRLGERVDSHDVIGSQLGDLNTRLGKLEPRINDAVSLRRELAGPNGALPNFGRLEDELKELGAVRENLRSADGSLGRFRDLERRLDTFERLGVNDELLDVRIESGIQSSLASRGLDAAALEQLIATRVDPVSTTVGALSAAMSGVQRTLGEQAGNVAGASNRIGALEAVAALSVDLPSRVAVLDAFRTGTAGTLVALRTDVNTALTLSGQVGSLRAGIEALDKRSDEFVRKAELDRVQEELKLAAARADALAEQSKSFATREDLKKFEERLDGTVRDQRTTIARVDLLQASTTNFESVTSARLQNVDGRVSALTDSNSKLSLDLGKLNQRIETIRPIERIGRGGST